MSETAAEKQGAVFRMENMLVKNLSVEMPDNVVAPEFANNPNVQLELRNSSRPLSRDNYYEVLLDATVRVRADEEIQLLIEASQAGIFFRAKRRRRRTPIVIECSRGGNALSLSESVGL